MNLFTEEPVSAVTAYGNRITGKSIQDRYRCPAGYFDFSRDELGQESGYFRFGDATAYGHTSNGLQRKQLSSALPDILSCVRIEQGRVTLPFEPEEAIENLRFERYPESGLDAFELLLKRVYYRLRPFTNAALRRTIQRFRRGVVSEATFPHWPVDTSVEAICEGSLLLAMRAKKVEEIPFVWFWPKGASGCVMMTHDVETQAGYDLCGQLMDIDDSYEIPASFQMVPEERYRVGTEGLKTIRERGFEICVQDLNHDGRLFDDHSEFQRRAAIINRYGKEYGAKGFRAAVLYRNLAWLQHLDFSFDMSVPNVAHLDPQRGGCCTVMPYFNGNVLELPVTMTQDYSLYSLLGERSIDLWKTQGELVRKKNGLLSFIVHPDYLVKADAKGLYLDLLEYLRQLRGQENLWFALPSDIDRWWRARSEMSVTQSGTSYKIEGNYADQAVLAFARIAEGRLVYRVCSSNEVPLPGSIGTEFVTARFDD